VIGLFTILVVEDEASIRKLAAVNLRARGYDVIDVASAEEGLVELRQHRVALIILDIKLPGMRGWQFLDASASFVTAPVIIMTASAADARSNAYKYKNVVQVLIKPFNTQILIEAVRQALGQNGGS
jgi:DNA-binding response OmpR family regulator